MARQASVYTSWLPKLSASDICIMESVVHAHHDTLRRARQIPEIELLRRLDRRIAKKSTLEILRHVRSLDRRKFSEGETKHGR